MKRVVLTVLVMVLISLGAGFGVNIAVTPTMDAEVSLVNVSGGGDAPRVWTVNAMNTGSQSFVGRFRADIRRGETVVDRVWSDAFVLEPGTEGARTLAVSGRNLNGSFNASVALVYGAGESSTVRDRFAFSERDRRAGFVIRTAWAADDKMYLGIIVPGDVERFFVSVDGAATRRFGQVEVTGADRYEQVVVPYHPRIDKSLETRVKVFDSRGRYHYTGKREVRRRTVMFPSLARTVDAVTGSFHVFFTRGK